jgi:hypothetical protein
MKFESITVVTMNIIVVWYVTQCSLVDSVSTYLANYTTYLYLQFEVKVAFVIPFERIIFV